GLIVSRNEIHLRSIVWSRQNAGDRVTLSRHGDNFTLILAVTRSGARAHRVCVVQLGAGHAATAIFYSYPACSIIISRHGGMYLFLSAWSAVRGAHPVLLR